MNSLLHPSLPFPAVLAIVSGSATLALHANDPLSSGEYFVTQSWSQEHDFKRPYHVHVPDQPGAKKLPVFLFLHGNGGNGKGAMNGFLRRHPGMASRYVMVFPDGYEKSWNIVSERSRADDRAFIEEIVETLSTFANVKADDFSIMGSSNGAALVNQLAIECRLPNIRNYVSSVSPLNVYQHDGENFKARGPNNDYRETVQPMRGKRLMNVSGTEDRLVPYRGGLSPAIPAREGKLGFVDAEESIFLWARAMGSKEPKLSAPSRIEGKLEIFSYLDGDVIHCKVRDEGHGATRAISEEMLLDFLEGGD